MVKLLTGLVAHVCNPSTSKLRQETDYKFQNQIKPNPDNRGRKL